MQPIKNFAIEMYRKIVNSPQFLRLLDFCRNHVTRMDLVAGTMLVGGFFIKPHLFGCNFLIPKICGAYFLGKGGLCLLQQKYPSYYEEMIHRRSAFASKIWTSVVPDDYMNCYRVIKTLFEPYLSQFDNFSSFSILGGIYKAGSNQEPIKLSNVRIDSSSKSIFDQASVYSEMATGMYGSAMVYGLMGEVDSPEDVKHLLSGTNDREGYKQAFCDHCHIAPNDLLYVNWGCEDDAVGKPITTSSGLQITPPPYFLVRHHATKSIVLCIRGTWCIKDFISDFKCCGIKWGTGKAHEGIALIANAMLNDDDLNKAITSALVEYPEYRVVAVGHSLGAGIASLITINWRWHHLYSNPVCFAIAPPPILSSSVRDKGVGYVFSFVNEDDLVPRLSKDGIEDALHRITNNCHEKRTWLHRTKKSTVETYQSLFAPSDTLVNMYLPGTVYYLHPCIEKYEEYEKRKRRVTDSEEKSVIEQVRRMIAKVEGSPGGCVYEKGSHFPNTVILSPMVLIHHFAFNYEKLIKRIDEYLDNRIVAVDMSKEC